MGTLHWVPIMPKDASHSDRSLNLFSWHTEVWKGVGKEGGGGGGGWKGGQYTAMWKGGQQFTAFAITVVEETRRFWIVFFPCRKIKKPRKKFQLGPTEKNNSEPTCSCPRGWRLSAIM